MPPVSIAVILAAGLGTRMLPATRAVPKELLPVVDKPLIEYAVEEAVASGIREVVIVTAPGKQAIREHFRGAEGPAISFVEQPEPRGIAHAVACARNLLEGRPFGLLFPDDLILAEPPCLAQLMEAASDSDASVIAVEAVAAEDVESYGIVDPEDSGNPCRLRGLVEKPSLAEAPSRLGIVGRYILGSRIFAHIDRTTPGRNGELQITDALATAIAAGDAVFALRYKGTRYDAGRPLGLVEANVALALARPGLGGQLAPRLRALLGGEWP